MIRNLDSTYIKGLMQEMKEAKKSEQNSNLSSARTDNIYKLPENLPIPIDDGACNHLLYKKLPSVELVATDGTKINLSMLKKSVILFCFPRTGCPDKNPPLGWNDIAGARGCTPQTCSFRDLYTEFKDLDVLVFGVSTQDTDYQQEVYQRLKLPFQLLSDSNFELTKILTLPTFEIGDMTLIKRLTIIADRTGVIQKVFYPVFPPTVNATDSLSWLKSKL